MDSIRDRVYQRYNNNPQQMARDGMTGYFAATGFLLNRGARAAGLTRADMPARSFSAFRRQMGWGMLRTPLGRMTMLAGAATVGTRWAIGQATGE
ncbi:hypothetical protein [Spirosoma foliorum]|uniref:Uncharacterized protein n=1 Tax=Spirosoma foliorum TaxID=2710596 RepID=A0A7G5GVX7_9BACT|nr:hypothetical protein [Spirosoma foliorum]QMW03019.1 hypothetical protein H3H32_34920 [Spirosoma foliorum]